MSKTDTEKEVEAAREFLWQLRGMPEAKGDEITEDLTEEEWAQMFEAENRKLAAVLAQAGRLVRYYKKKGFTGPPAWQLVKPWVPLLKAAGVLPK